MTSKLNKNTFLFLSFAALFALAQAPASAAMVTTDQLAENVQTESRRADVLSLLARDEVRSQMQELGVSADDAERRVNQMTGAELATLQSKLDTLPAGGEVLGIILTIVLIFLLLDLAGVTDVFPGV